MNKTPEERRLKWGLGPIEELLNHTRIGIAIFQNEKIQALYVFLD